MARVVIAGKGALGSALAARLADAHEVRTVGADLTSLPETEVELAGAEVVVFLARTREPVARHLRAAPADLDLLMADTVARAAKLVAARHVIHFACSDDARTRLFERAGLPLSVLTGGGPDPVEHLVAMVNAAPGSHRQGAAWSKAAEPRSEPRYATCSVQRWKRPPGMKALELVRAHFEWLAGDVPLLRVKERAGVFTLTLAGTRLLVLRHVPGRSDDDVAWLEISDGALRRDAPQGRFEFRCLLDGTTAMAALLGYEPSLPFALYRFTQAFMHERVMRRFGEHLSSLAPPA